MAVLLSILLSSLLVLTSATSQCCMYTQWEGVLFFGYASSGQQDFIFCNGTASVSYDLVNAMTFVNFEIYKRSASSISVDKGVVITHFNKGVKYMISTVNKTCEKGPVSSTKMTTYCASDGSNCMPLFVSGIIKAPGLGIEGAADFLDLQEGIRDPNVFTPPSYCSEQPSKDNDGDSFFASLLHKKQQK
ncbi:uncharacterized protein [Argopecten irradians]|uniref:uncharacterized protein isoform X2 n=1 Tax=Argopecten irradians TaxID=31199 RepID=UPI00371BFB15